MSEATTTVPTTATSLPPAVGAPASIGAGVVHVALGIVAFGSGALAIGFLATGILQVAVGFALLGTPRREVVVAALLVNAVALLALALSRTVGLPVLLPEAVPPGLPDAITGLLQLNVLVAVATGLRTGAPRMDHHRAAVLVGWGVAAIAAIAALSRIV